MLLIPRVHECFQAISLNSLAFAGALLVNDQVQLERICSAGPLSALKAVTPAREER
jgi:ATP adenylyltransferase